MLLNKKRTKDLLRVVRPLQSFLISCQPILNAQISRVKEIIYEFIDRKKKKGERGDYLKGSMETGTCMQ